MNPYKVLGVSENATQDEIRKAYLALVKKYHPDRYSDGPMKDMANEKLKEINQAYELLTKKKESSGYGGGSGYGGYSSYGQNTWSQGGYWQNQGSYSGDYAQEFSRVRSYFAQNNLNAAQSVLDNIPLHNAEWHYLYGILHPLLPLGLVRPGPAAPFHGLQHGAGEHGVSERLFHRYERGPGLRHRAPQHGRSGLRHVRLVHHHAVPQLSL